MRKRLCLREIVELPVVQTAAGQLLFPTLGGFETALDVVDRVHCARVVDVIAGDEGGIERSGLRRMQQLEDEAGFALRIPHEDPVDPEVLGTRVRVQIFPFWLLRIGWRLHRIRPDMAETAGHPDPVGSHEIIVVIIGWVAV